ncbi:glycine cleavage system protein GcvH [Candidatus Zixiibacteriota bacterium]
MNIPQDLVYSKEHEWCRVDGETAVIGITDFAQGELGDVVFLELPEAGDTAVAGDEFGTIEAVKAVAELFAPLSGEVVEVNAVVMDSPETVNEDPYGNGWMIKISISDPSELDGLMDASAYEAMIGEGE